MFLLSLALVLARRLHICVLRCTGRFQPGSSRPIYLPISYLPSKAIGNWEWRESIFCRPFRWCCHPNWLQMTAGFQIVNSCFHSDTRCRIWRSAGFLSPPLNNIFGFVRPFVHPSVPDVVCRALRFLRQHADADNRERPCNSGQFLHE